MGSKSIGMNQVINACLVLAGVGMIIKGITAKAFTEQSVGWFPGQEKFKPGWHHRFS